ncbi:MAG: hypothetical protein ACRDD4_12730 [Culicoidibacterales bacterium]
MYLIIDDFDSRKENTPVTTFSDLSDSLQISANGMFEVDSEFLGFKLRNRTVNLLVQTKKKLTEIKGKILKQKNQKVVFGDNPDYHHFAKITSTTERHIASDYYELSIAFEVDPFAYLKEKTVSLEISGTVENTGNVASEPKITVYGNGIDQQIVIGDYVLKVDIETKLVIECSQKLVNVYDQFGNVANHRMRGDFPKLKTGLNGITFSSGIAKIEIELKERVI